MAKFFSAIAGAIAMFVVCWYFWGGKGQTETSAEVAPAETVSNSTSFEVLSREPSNENTAMEEQLNNIIYSIKNKDDVDPAIIKINEFAAKHPNKVAPQMYKTFVSTVKYFKGMAWRLRFIVEPVDAAYVASISYLRAFKRNNDRRAKHIDALFDYVTEPNEGEDIFGQKTVFASAAEFQDYMANKVAKAVEVQIKDFTKILKDHGNNADPLFEFDAGLILGNEEFGQAPSKTSRWRKFMPGHLKGMIANLYERMGIGLYVASYDMEALQFFLNTLTRNSFVSKKGQMDTRTGVGRNLVTTVFDVHLQSPKEVSQLLNKMAKTCIPGKPVESQNNAQCRFLTLRSKARGENGYLRNSLVNIRNAINYRIEAFKDMEILAKRANRGQYVIDADFITSRPAITLAALQKRRDLLFSNGPTTFNDRVNNKSFEVNISALFNSNNPNVADLKRLYPSPEGFSNIAETNGGPRKTFKWNYDYGTPQNWPDVSFGGVLPNTKNAEDYRKKLVSISRDASTPALTYWLRLFM